MAEVDLTPPAAAAKAAEQGLKLRKEHKRGGTRVGVARAHQLMKREPLSADVVKRSGRNTVRTPVWCIVVASQLSNSTVRIAATGSLGIRPASGWRLARNSRIAVDSVRICRLPSAARKLSAGTRPRGLMARYSGLRLAPSAITTRTGSQLTPQRSSSSSSAMCGASEQAPGEWNS